MTLIPRHQEKHCFVACSEDKIKQGLCDCINRMRNEALHQPVVSGSLLVEIKSLLYQYRDEEMPDWDTPYHYDAEGWAAMKYFIQWLERKSNDR